MAPTSPARRGDPARALDADLSAPPPVAGPMAAPADDAPTPAWQRRGSAVVNAILEATRAEIVRVGYFDLRIDEVARLAGVNKTTVYRRWPDRLSLVRDALVDTIEAVDLPPLTGQVSTDLRRHLYALCALTDTPVGAAMVAARMKAQENLEVLQLMEQMRVVHEDRPRRILAAGVAAGQLRPDFDVELALGMLHGAFQLGLGGDRVCVGLSPAFVDRVVDLLMEGALRRA